MPIILVRARNDVLLRLRPTLFGSVAFVSPFARVIELNKTATVFLVMLGMKYTEDQIVASIAERFGLDEQVVREDFCAFLSVLEGNGVSVDPKEIGIAKEDGHGHL
jgi:hypothetical protein